MQQSNRNKVNRKTCTETFYRVTVEGVRTILLSLISSDATDRYNLHKFAERVKKDQIVYHNLADVVAENMRDVDMNSGSDYFDMDGWTSSSFYLKWLSLKIKNSLLR